MSGHAFDVDGKKFEVGDWALHAYQLLDEREVAEVGDGWIKLRIGNLVSDRVFANNYHRIR